MIECAAGQESFILQWRGTKKENPKILCPLEKLWRSCCCQRKSKRRAINFGKASQSRRESFSLGWFVWIIMEIEKIKVRKCQNRTPAECNVNNEAVSITILWNGEMSISNTVALICLFVSVPWCEYSHQCHFGTLPLQHCLWNAGRTCTGLLQAAQKWIATFLMLS